MSYWQQWLKRPRTVWLRKALFQIHLWSGLGVGLYLVVISVTGSVLVFRSELRQTFMPQPVFVAAEGERLDEDGMIAAAERAWPDASVSIFAERDEPTQAVTIPRTVTGTCSRCSSTRTRARIWVTPCRPAGA